MYEQILVELKKSADSKRAEVNAWFFKDYEYLGYKNKGDKFLGVRVPDNRKIVLRFWKNFLSLRKDFKVSTWQQEILELIQKLFNNEYHEVRLAGAILLHMLYKQVLKEGDLQYLKKLFVFYNKNVGWNKGINNWDLVDETARDIAGHYVAEVMTHDERLKWLDNSIKSRDLWVNRVAVVATWWEIKKGNEKICFYVVEKLLNHQHDLIHKVCGWMLREVGKNCGKEVLEKFLLKNVNTIPRTCLRYAIEHFPQNERQNFLKM